MLARSLRPFLRPLGLSLAPLCGAGVALGLADPSSPPQADAAASGAEPAVVVFFGGLDALLPDPRDADLRRALAMLDERLLELPAELGNAPLPPDAAELLVEVLSSPWTLAVDVVEDAAPGAPPVRVRLSVQTESAAEAEALAARLEALLSQAAGAPAEPVEGQPRLEAFELPFGRLFFGSDEQRLVLAFGEPLLGEATLGAHPWGNPYLYDPSASPRPRIYTYGADGLPGGDGEDGDVDSLQIDDWR